MLVDKWCHFFTIDQFESRIKIEFKNKENWSDPND